MTRYAYLSRAGGAWQLAGFEDHRPIDSPAEVAGIMVSRLEFVVQAIELPAMAEKEVEGFLTYRIRSLYPGQPEQTAFDYRILDRGGKRHAVLFLFQRDTLEECRRVAAGRPLFSSTSVLLPLLGEKKPEGDLVCLFWHDTWLEALVLREGEPPRSYAGRRGLGAEADLNQLLGLAGVELKTADCLLVCLGEEQEALAKLVASRQSETGKLTVLSSAQALRQSARGPESLFAAHKAPFPVPRGLRLELGAALVLLLSLLAVKRGVDRDAAYLSGLRREMQAVQGRSSQALALEQEIAELQAQAAKLAGKRPADPFRVLSELQAVLGPGTRINSFVLDRGSFQMEAVGSDPLRLMEVFKSRGDAFEKVKLIQIVPLKDSSRELFRITGYAHAQ